MGSMWGVPPKCILSQICKHTGNEDRFAKVIDGRCGNPLGYCCEKHIPFYIDLMKSIGGKVKVG